MNKRRFQGNAEERMRQVRAHLVSAAEQCTLEDLLFEAALVAKREDLPVEAARSVAKGIFAARGTP
jgi:hypothetical protein